MERRDKRNKDKWIALATMGIFTNSYAKYSFYQKSKCASNDNRYDVNSNECVKFDCGLMDDAIMHYKKVLLNMAKGHFVKMRDMTDLYKKILLVETSARVEGFKTNNCNIHGK